MQKIVWLDFLLFNLDLQFMKNIGTQHCTKNGTDDEKKLLSASLQMQKKSMQCGSHLIEAWPK